MNAGASEPRSGPGPSLWQKGSRRSRLTFLWGLGAFVLLQAGLAVGIERWLPELRDPLYAFKVQRLLRRTEQAPVKPFTVVLLGSSRTIFGFKASLLEAPLSEAAGRPVVVFNFGITGAGPVTNLLMLRRLLADGVRPDLLLMEVLPPLLTKKPEVAEVNRLNPDRLRWRDLPVVEHYGRPGPELREDWWLTCLVPWYEHRFAIMSRTVPAYLPWRLRLDWFQTIDDSGWVDSPGGMAGGDHREAIERTRLEYDVYMKDFQVGGHPVEALREQLELCRREGIPTALVLMPESSAFRSWYPPSAWPQIDGLLEEVRQEYGLPVINAREWIADEQFSDGHHLLLSGAEAFTLRLGREAIWPLVQRGLHAATGEP